MARYLRDDDSICSIATAPGQGAIAVIRLSGPQSYSIISKLASFLPEKPESHRVYYGLLKNKNHQPIDEVMITYFEAGRSFTTQETVEVSCHGGVATTRAILRELISSGARLADPGEFTYRAFINGRIDLTQAEAVLSLVHSHSELSARAALRALSGKLKTQVFEIEEKLLWALSRLEANIDFAAEDIEFAQVEEILKKVRTARQETKALIESYRKGRLLRDGIRVALIGPPNAGKSSLLNKILEEDRAIVSSLAGTTRDRIDETILINGIQFIFSDTAGIRETENEIEKLGIERSIKAIQDADVVLKILSPDTAPLDDGTVDKMLEGKRIISLLNKADLISAQSKNDGTITEIQTSTVTGEGIEELKELLCSEIELSSETDAAAIFQARHYELFKNAEIHLGFAEMMLSDSASPEFVISELQDALYSVMEVTGRKFDDEVLDRVFKDFCLGK